MKRQKIAKILIIATVCISALMFLPWVYMTPLYYIARYAIMAMMAVVFALTFSLTRSFSARFVRLLLLTICCMILVRLTIPMYTSDITQLAVALLTVIVGMNLDWRENDWANICYYYTILLIGVSISNSLFYAGGLYVPEHYMFDEGKNQLGAMMAIGATACFHFGMKRKDDRTAYWVIAFLTLLCLVLIRSRADCFALIIMMLLISIKDADLQVKWNVKTVLTIVGLILIGVIIYTGFIHDELHTFMHGGKSSTGINDLTTRRWDRNQKGFELLRHNQTIQEMQTPMKIPFIHNYPLLRLVRYRLFSTPLLLFYIYFGISTLIEVFKSKRSNVKQVGWIVCCVPLIISFAEPNFPYGPGLVQMLAFLLLGYSLRTDGNRENLAGTVEADTVLHICNDFYYSKVHSNLYHELDQAGVKQIVFSPVRKGIPENHLFEAKQTTFHYAHILKRLHRVFFFHKTERIVREIEKTIDLSQISCIHATTLFSDGMVAETLHQKYGIPYIVAVRNCDVNAFLRYMPHLWWVHRAVLETADKVIFIAPALRERLLKHPTLVKMRDLTEKKSLVIPNGINEFWIKNLHTVINPDNSHRVLYAGIFNRNKNMPRLIHAMQSLRSEFPDLHLDVAGGGGDDEKQVLSLMRKHPDWISYHGIITDLEEMRKLYLSNGIFAMPSKSETFGLVYIEALSQGLRLLWSRGEAIDGMFTEHLGESVNPMSHNDLVHKLRQLLRQNVPYDTLPDTSFETFRWSNIAKDYISLYSNVTSKKSALSPNN